MAAAAICVGCFGHKHIEWNAPGDIEVLNPAPEPRPKDPGEHLLLFSGGLFGGGGAGFGIAGTGGRTVGAAGIEASLHYAELARSHPTDTTWFTPEATAYGVNLGWTPVNAFGTTPGAGYLEAQVSRLGLYGGAAGWAWDPRFSAFEGEGAHGPQITGFLGPLYARGSFFLNRGFELHFGLTIKAGHFWTWSK